MKAKIKVKKINEPFFQTIKILFFSKKRKKKEVVSISVKQILNRKVALLACHEQLTNSI